MAELLLKTEKLTKSFGGLVAINELSMEIKEGEIHAVIGPNGAGKTTLIAQLSGSLRPDSGSIFFQSQDITQLPEYRRSSLGLARSFQITSVLQNFSALDNVALAVQSQAGHSFRFWNKARKATELRNPALKVLSPGIRILATGDFLVRMYCQHGLRFQQLLKKVVACG